MALSPAAQTIFETRRAQMFPTLEASDIERMRRFGTMCSYAAGEALLRVGQVGRGLTIILSGKVDMTQRDAGGRRELIVTHETGGFMGELATLSARPALV